MALLIPARTDTAYFHGHILGRAEVRLLRGRLRFGGAEHGATFPSAVCIWRGGKALEDDELVMRMVSVEMWAHRASSLLSHGLAEGTSMDDRLRLSHLASEADRTLRRLTMLLSELVEDDI